MKKELDKIEMKMLGDGDSEANVLLPAKGMATEKVLALARKLKNDENSHLVGLQMSMLIEVCDLLLFSVSCLSCSARLSFIRASVAGHRQKMGWGVPQSGPYR